MTLTDLAEERVHEGRLPDLRKCRTYGGPSMGRTCALCEKPIPKKATEIEVICKAANWPSIFVHLDCYAAWSRAPKHDIAT